MEEVKAFVEKFSCGCKDLYFKDEETGGLHVFFIQNCKGDGCVMKDEKGEGENE